ncbi:MAG: glycosyltransferase family 4 protein [Anaerolineales bacterium]|nr:glycosyltransferase family 4 protein [Anaerolineales bacterium]
MKLIILTQYYPPETGAPQRRLSDLARRLAAIGHQVQVLTAKPNYPEGKIFPGYKKGLFCREREGGIEVIRVWLYPNQSKSLALRLANYFSFVLSSILIGTFTLGRADFLIVESPPLFLGISARFLAAVKRARLVFNVSDLYPETAISLGMLDQPLLQKLLYALEAWCYAGADFITGQTEGIVASIRARFPHKKVHLLTNGIDLESVARKGRPAANDREGKFRVGYAGIIGHAQRLDTVVRAAGQLAGHPEIEFSIFGDGPLLEDLVALAEETGAANLHFHGRRSHEEIMAEMESWDAGLVPLANVPLMKGALPSKMFEVMGMELPVILCAPAGEASSLIETAQAGVCVQAENVDALVEAVLHLAAHPDLGKQYGQNGRAYIEQHFNRQVIAEKFVAFITFS